MPIRVPSQVQVRYATHDALEDPHFRTRHQAGNIILLRPTHQVLVTIEDCATGDALAQLPLPEASAWLRAHDFHWLAGSQGVWVL